MRTRLADVRGMINKMATTDSEQITNGIDNLNVDNATDSNANPPPQLDDEFQKKWGLPVQEVYKIAVRFFKEKEGKALQLTYQTKLKLVAFTKQATFGKFRPDVSPDVGFLDVVGNDRNASTDPSEWQAWQALGNMSKEVAMAEFVEKMADSCSLFEPHVEAHKAEKEEAAKREKEEEERKKVEEEEAKKKAAEEAARQVQEAEKQKQHEQELQIRAALNQQTAAQFRQYAEQQYANNKEMQDDLIKQLQDQHFQQYMQQVYQQQLLQQQQQQQQQLQQQSATITATNINTPNGEVTTAVDNGNNNTSPVPDGVTPIPPGGDDEEDYPLAVASMWTRKDIKEFKDSLRKDKESVIKIGSGETVTVRVPTHEDGTCLFWEFATDYYDIGFGVYFEWSVSQTNTVSVHISESSDEEDLEEEEGKEGKANDVEKGPGSKKAENRPPTDEIIPVYRRDCHEEVYCGSHTYPGQGVYLLKFDNSYSLWRSKTLYYRVYYSR
ncbi:Golgi resident protein GCP60 isoform X2 [Aplysia californica]|uniref:Golgi resident protein GCP60 isoform X2 n=1 Tax=Aplysia californica TaxID=6500 RepID=A0ABM1W346_APLCA|nr:Golgi resident protein GCP60 isoform X2 [Aplysia californica]